MFLLFLFFPSLLEEKKTHFPSSMAAYDASVDWSMFPSACAFFGSLKCEKSINTYSKQPGHFSKHPDYAQLKAKDRIYMGRHACASFNGLQGSHCKTKECMYRHECLVCGSTEHGFMDEIGGKPVCAKTADLEIELSTLKEVFGNIEQLYDLHAKEHADFHSKRRRPTSAWQKPIVTPALIARQSRVPAPAPAPASMATILHDPITLKVLMDGIAFTTTAKTLALEGLSPGFTMAIHVADNQCEVPGVCRLNTHGDKNDGGKQWIISIRCKENQ